MIIDPTTITVDVKLALLINLYNTCNQQTEITAGTN